MTLLLKEHGKNISPISQRFNVDTKGNTHIVAKFHSGDGSIGP